MIIDLCAGPGGWDEAAADLGVRPVGIEVDRSACATRAAAGHQTIRADIATFPLERLHGRVEGLIGSPPCPTFSQAGKREGMADMAALHEAARAFVTDPAAQIPTFSDPRTGLVLEPLRWACQLVPEWVALEQVPPVLELWETVADVLRALGWATWTGILNAADYGVPQTRQRAFLLASRARRPGPPAPTHTQSPMPVLFGDELTPWVSMADALGWESSARCGFPRLDDRGDSPDGYRERDWRDGDEPAFALTEKARSWVVLGVNTGRDWKPGGTRADAQVVPADEPAPTVDATGRWHALYEAVGPLWGDRPATTVQCDSRLWPPGHKINADDIDRLGAEEAAARYGDRAGTTAIRLTLADALVLQSFRPDYPVQGTKSKQFEQVGNAVPPRLARHALAEVIG